MKYKVGGESFREFSKGFLGYVPVKKRSTKK